MRTKSNSGVILFDQLTICSFLKKDWTLKEARQYLILHDPVTPDNNKWVLYKEDDCYWIFHCSEERDWVSATATFPGGFDHFKKRKKPPEIMPNCGTMMSISSYQDVPLIRDNFTHTKFLGGKKKVHSRGGTGQKKVRRKPHD